jgi:VWFA-related protein
MFRIAVAACVTVGCLCPSLSAGQPVERDVYVTVVDKAGLPIRELGAPFFAVREDGQDRDVVRAEPALGPMQLALLVDTSAAMLGSLEAYRSALLGFVGKIPAGSSIAVYEFGANAIPVVPFTQDTAALTAGIQRLAARQDTIPRLVDAVAMASGDLKALNPSRPVIVAVSLGRTDNSGKTAGSAIKQLIDLPAPFYAVAVSTASGGPERPSLTSASGRDIVARQERLRQMEAEGEGNREQTQVLMDGTKKTGGTLQRVASTLAVDTALTRIWTEIAEVYRVTYLRQGSGKPRNLQVGVLLDDVDVRATAAPVGPRR